MPGTKYKCVIFKYTMQVAIFLTLPSFHVCVVVVWWPVSSCLEEHGGRSLETPGSIKCVMMLFGCYLAAVFMLSLLCHCYVTVMLLHIRINVYLNVTCYLVATFPLLFPLLFPLWYVPWRRQVAWRGHGRSFCEISASSRRVSGTGRPQDCPP